MHNKQKIHKIDIDDFAKIVKLSAWCFLNLKDDEYERITIRLLPPVYRFKFKCEKKKFWAVLNS